MIQKRRSTNNSGTISVDYYEIFEITNVKNNLNGLGIYLNNEDHVSAWSEIREQEKEIRFYANINLVEIPNQDTFLRILKAEYRIGYDEYSINDNFIDSPIY